MLHVNNNSPVLRTVFSAAFLFLSIFNLAPSATNAQAFDQLNGAAHTVEVPLVSPPQNATLYTVAPGLNVYFINVGQGDSIYIELPGGKNALIDGGPSKTAPALAKFLSDKKVTNIDQVVLTHPHSDHYNGLGYVFSNYTVGNFYDTRLDNKGATGDDTVRAQVKALGINTIYPAAGDHLNWSSAPGLDIKVFNACSEAMSSSNSNEVNNCSITFKLTYQGSSILFTGDTQNDAEARLVAKYGSELKADVLKVGHHGSKYSSTEIFLNAVRPAKAYIEVGKNNYGHPTQGALDRLTAIGAKIFRTDLDDTQEFSVDSSSITSEKAAD